MKYHNDLVIVKLPELLKEESKFKGIDGKPLIIDAAFNPERHVRNYGEIVSVPNKLSAHKPFILDPVGPPMYMEEAPMHVIGLDKIPIVLKPGDKAYFHHNMVLWALEGQNMVKEERHKDGTRTYWISIQYDQVFCGVRDGKIIANATWVLIEPDMESWDDIYHPVPELDKDGNPKIKWTKKWDDKKQLMEDVPEPVLLPKEKWIQMKVAPEHKAVRGFVKHIGEPIDGDTCDINVGDHIIYRTHGDFKVEIEGKEYFLIRQRHIEGFVC